ncbi:MAG: DUF4082 domain-containing protein [Mycobacterium sp.]|nr:DUF4082 domain-containing protein [Mycobacterium sp.]
MGRGLLVAGAAVVLVGSGVAVAATQNLKLGGGDSAFTSCTGQSASVSRANATDANVSCPTRRSPAEALYTTNASVGPENSDTRSVTLGVKFAVARGGSVSGVRFYRPANSTARIVDLWQGGTKLAAASAPASGTGWVDAHFATPVAVRPGTTYLASYFTSRYVATTHGFDVARTVQDITAPVGAGVYEYGTSPTAPTGNYENSEYYVSPLFAPGTTPTPTPTPTTHTPTPTPSPSPSNYSCSVPLGGSCGAYTYSGIPMSNGYDTYVSNQAVGAQSGTTETMNANDPADWDVVAHARPYGYTGVQTFPDVQQLTNDWCPGEGGWAKDSTCTADTPLDSLSTLKVNYAETSPQNNSSIYEFAPDVWTDNYGSDVMFWVDTHGRCNEGAFGGTLLGHAVLDGQNWTVHRYGGPGAEIIFVLDGAGGTGTCAQQSSGTIDIKAGFNWLTTNGFVTGPVVMSQLNTGWEITSADNTTFSVTSYSITAS